MSIASITVAVAHLTFAAVWTGSVLFMTYAVLPAAARGDLNAGPFESIVGKLTTVSRLSAVVLFATGGHLAGTLYTVDSLTGTTRGHLVLAMLGLWFVLAALVEVGAARIRRGTGRDKVREPARNGRRAFQAAALAALALLVDAGLLMSGAV